MNEERTGKCLRQVEHIRGHLLDVDIFSATITTMYKTRISNI